MEEMSIRSIRESCEALIMKVIVAASYIENHPQDRKSCTASMIMEGMMLFKFDGCAAYKQIRLIIDDWHLQGEMFMSDKGVCFDFCSAANFGARSSGFIWENYGLALEFVYRWVAFVDAVVRYVDDFLVFLAPHHDSHDSCRFLAMKDRILSLSNRMGVNLDKFAEGTRMIFLGVLVDSILLRFEIPLNDWLSLSTNSSLGHQGRVARNVNFKV